MVDRMHPPETGAPGSEYSVGDSPGPWDGGGSVVPWWLWRGKIAAIVDQRRAAARLAHRGRPAGETYAEPLVGTGGVFSADAGRCNATVTCSASHSRENVLFRQARNPGKLRNTVPSYDCMVRPGSASAAPVVRTIWSQRPRAILIGLGENSADCCVSPARSHQRNRGWGCTSDR